jgi:hypothetical protein
MSKEKYCARILNSYSILVDYEGEVDRVNVPSPLDESETFAHWKHRVLGEDIYDVKIYIPQDIPGKTLISTVQNKIDSRHVEKVFDRLRKDKNDEKKQAIDKAIQETEIKYTTFSTGTLEEIIENLDLTLENPVKDFLNKYMQENLDVKTEELIEKLVILYNEAARQFRLLDRQSKLQG